MSTEKTTTTLLSEWLAVTDKLLLDERYEEALLRVQLILRNLPRHLATYERLLHIAWQLQLWDEGMVWGARLLRADPGNPLAWRSLAMSIEQKGHRARAWAIWQRAFETGPYDADVRTGLSRTTLRGPAPLTLNDVCLATLYIRNGRWQQAHRQYQALLETTDSSNEAHFGTTRVEASLATPVHSTPALLETTTIDFQSGLMISLWQMGRHQQAYQIARRLLQKKQTLLFPWYVINNVGDVNDQALAHNPLQIMDPDGEYIRNRLGIEVGQKFVEIEVTTPEVELLSMIG